MAKAAAKKAPAKKAPVKKSPGRKPSRKDAEPTVASGVGVGSPPNKKNDSRAQAVERAMSEAIAKAISDGISDPKEQRELMLAARDEALKG